jgi:hypothetical protein
MSSDIIGIAVLDLQGIAVLLGGVSAYVHLAATNRACARRASQMVKSSSFPR